MSAAYTMVRIVEWDLQLSSNSRPQTMVVEVSGKCSLGCRHCFRNVVEDELDLMDFKTMKQVILEARRAGVKRIVVSGWGEPFENPLLMDFLKAAVSNGFQVAVNTNGVALSDYASRLVDLGVDEIIVSVDGFTPRTYAGIRGSKYYDVLEGLERIKYERVKRAVKKPSVTLQFTLTKLNYRDLEHATEFASRYGAGRIVVSNLIPLTSDMEKSLACYTDEQCSRFIEQLAPRLGAELFYAYVNVVLPSMKPRIERRCPYTTSCAVYVRWDGGISPCLAYAHSWSFCLQGIQRSVHAIVWGSISDGLLNVWRRRNYWLFRFRAYVGFIPSCLDCSLKEYCEVTLSNERDCWGNTPSCHFCPFLHGLSSCPI